MELDDVDWDLLALLQTDASLSNLALAERTGISPPTALRRVRDMPAYQALAERLFTQDANVRNVRTFFSIKRAKFVTSLPLDAPRADRAPQ